MANALNTRFDGQHPPETRILMKSVYPIATLLRRCRAAINTPLLITPLLLTSFALHSAQLSANTDIAAIQFDEQYATTAKDIIGKLEARHYLGQKLDDQLSSRLLDNYLQRLDGSKSFFLQTDIDEFEGYRHILDDSLNSGDLQPGLIIFNRYQQRLVSRLEALTEELPAMVAAMDFERDEQLLLDREEAHWPQDIAATDDLWRKRIKSAVIGLRISEKPEDEIIPLLQKRYRNQLNRVRQSQAEDAFQLYMNSLASLYDPHTNYLSPRTSENFNINMSLSLQGIGAVLQSEDEYTKVVRLVHAGPADKQGQLQPADRIVAVAQDDGEFEDVIGLRLDEVVQLIRGEKDTVVRLEVIPVAAKTDEEHIIIKIVRDKVKLEEQSAQKKVLEIYHRDRVAKIGIIDVPAFYIDFDAMRNGDLNYKSTTRDVRKLLEELIDEGVEGIIIDLRENGGGSLQEANQLTGLFIEQGPTVQIRNSDTQVYRDGKRVKSDYYRGPLLVLINRLSASASEIFAGAIQDYQRGLVVGTQSFGKGTVQSLTPLEQGQLKITESKFYRISGESTQHRGVIPDITFPAIYDSERVGESSLDNALPWDRIDPIRHRRYFNFAGVLPEIKEKHQSRIANDPDFIFLQDQLALMEQARSITSIPLNEQQRRDFQEHEKQRSLKIENKRRIAKGIEPLASFDEIDGEDASKASDKDATDTTDDSSLPASSGDAYKDQTDALKDSAAADTEQADDEESSETIGPLLTESGYILMDSVSAFSPSRVATSGK